MLTDNEVLGRPQVLVCYRAWVAWGGEGYRAKVILKSWVVIEDEEPISVIAISNEDEKVRNGLRKLLCSG